MSLSEVESQNFALVFGCPPGIGVAADTQMIFDVQQALIHKFNKETLTLEFPNICDHLQGKDANFEMITSNSTKVLRLTYHHNVVKEARAYIFVSTSMVGRYENLSD